MNIFCEYIFTKNYFTESYCFLGIFINISGSTVKTFMFSLSLSNQWSKSHSREYRYEKGQFFTPIALRTPCWEHLPTDFVPRRCLEPSCGSGEFLHDLQQRYPNVTTDAFDIDATLIDSIRLMFNCNIQCVDFLNYNITDKYDLIVGNPPYSELSKDKNYSDYESIIEGRSNLFALFIFKSIQLLNDNGYLYFVIPSTLLVSQSFHRLRQWIHQQGNIIYLSTVNSDDTMFVEAQQGVTLFMFQKTSRLNDNYKFHLSIPDKEIDYLIFTDQQDYFRQYWNSSRTLTSMGMYVRTGSLSWNQVKDELSNDRGIRIIYSHNIGDDGEYRYVRHKHKLEYWNPPVVNKRTEKGPVLLMNRITGTSSRIRTLLWESDEIIIAENHVQVIYGTLEQLRWIQNSFKNSQTLRWIQNITYTTQCSKRDLEERIVFF